MGASFAANNRQSHARSTLTPMSTHTTMTQTDITMNAYSRVASFVSSICELPAVATPDWCVRVAQAASTLTPGARAGAMVAMVEPDGRVGAIETAGYAASPANAIGLQTADDGAVRARLERIGNVGFRPGDHAAQGFVVGRLNALTPTGAGRATLPTDALDTPASRVLVALSHIPGASPGCALVVFVALPEPAASLADEIVLALEAGIPILARRAAMALGNQPCSNAPWLTAREHEVLEQLILGRSVKQIASVLGRSPHTVHDHVKSLHRKLNASTRGGLVARALGRPDPGPEVDDDGQPSAAGPGSMSA
jgi:DNA-binding CsgD family transcriptional regulator